MGLPSVRELASHRQPSQAFRLGCYGYAAWPHDVGEEAPTSEGDLACLDGSVVGGASEALSPPGVSDANRLESVPNQAFHERLVSRCCAHGTSLGPCLCAQERVAAGRLDQVCALGRADLGGEIVPPEKPLAKPHDLRAFPLDIITRLRVAGVVIRASLRGAAMQAELRLFGEIPSAIRADHPPALRLGWPEGALDALPQANQLPVERHHAGVEKAGDRAHFVVLQFDDALSTVECVANQDSGRPQVGQRTRTAHEGYPVELASELFSLMPSEGEVPVADQKHEAIGHTTSLSLPAPPIRHCLAGFPSVRGALRGVEGEKPAVSSGAEGRQAVRGSYTGESEIRSTMQVSAQPSRVPPARIELAHAV